MDTLTQLHRLLYAISNLRNTYIKPTERQQHEEHTKPKWKKLLTRQEARRWKLRLKLWPTVKRLGKCWEGNAAVTHVFQSPSHRLSLAFLPVPSFTTAFYIFFLQDGYRSYQSHRWQTAIVSVHIRCQIRETFQDVWPNHLSVRWIHSFSKKMHLSEAPKRKRYLKGGKWN